MRLTVKDLLVYLVNSVNDSIYEKAGQGYDKVMTNTSYLLNANIE